MKRWRDRTISLVGLGVLAMLVGSSTYYALRTNLMYSGGPANKDSPAFVTRDCVITTFKADGSADRRLFAKYAEHYSDGRTTSIQPRFVTLDPDKPQLKASANTGSSLDDGESAVFTGNVLITRDADKEHPAIRLSTTHATVYPDSGIVTSGAPVRIESGTDVMTGIGLRFDNVDRSIILHSNVHSFITPRNKDSSLR